MYRKTQLSALSLCLLLCACNQPSSEPGGDASRAADGSSASAVDQTDASTPGDASTAPKSSAAATGARSAKVELASHAQLQEHIKASQGRVVVIDVWSTSCLPCMQEFPHLVELAQRWPEDLVCFSMNVDYLGLPSNPAESYIPKVTEFLNSQAAQPDNLVHLISSEPDSDILTKFEIESMPGILVLDRQGKQVAKLTIDNAGDDGLSYAGDVVPLVESLIERK